MLLLFFLGLGMFNAISTCIDQICQIKGLSTEQTGLVGGMMLIAGIIGAVVLPVLSDKFRKRKAFILVGMIFMTPGLIGLTVFTGYIALLLSSFVLGFFLLGACAPVGFQYCAEVSIPAPESTSQGLLLLVGQISGILFIFGMHRIGMIPSLFVFVGFSIVGIILSAMIKESPMIQDQKA
jgi:MFS family permease